MARAYGPGSYDPKYEKQGQDYPISYVRWTEKRNMEEFLRLVSQGAVQIQPLITHQFNLADASTAYQTIMDPASNSLAVTLRYPAADSVSPAGHFKPKYKVPVASQTRSAERGKGHIRTALIGAGNLARWAHLPVIKKLPGVSLHAVYSASGARGKSYARRFGASYCTSDYQDILRDPEIDMVMILSRNQHHAPQALEALRAGKHVFLEKPMALTEEECRELHLAVKESGKLLTVGFNRRFAPFYVDQKKAIARRSGPAVINCRVNSPGISGEYWMADPSIGGAILGEACHFVDLMYWLLDSEPVNVTAYSLPLDQREPVGSNNLAASFRFADGSIGNLTYCTVGSQTSGGERVEVFAQGVGAVVDNFKRLEIKTRLRSSKSKWWADKGYAEQMASFVDAIRSGNRPEIDVVDGARSTIGCLKMLESARALAPCEIDLEGILG
jgi:predicted dehydrogenase